MLRWLAFPQVFLDLDEPFSSEKKLPMAKEMSVGAEILGRFRRGHITFVPDLSRQISTFEWCFLPTGRPSDAIAKDGSWRFRQRQGRGTNWHYGNVQHSKICVVHFLDSYRIIKMYSHFPAVYYVWCKDVEGAIFGWVDFDESSQAWYHYKDFWACWESMRLSTLRRLAISSNGIKTYLLQSTWQGQYVLVIKNVNRRAPFSRGNHIISHPPMWIPWHFHKHLRIPEAEDLRA